MFANAEIAQLVEHNLAKVGVASSSLVFRSKRTAKSVVLFLFRPFSVPFFCLNVRFKTKKFYICLTPCGNSSAGRASASQAEGRGFESRFPLFMLATYARLAYRWLCAYIWFIMKDKMHTVDVDFGGSLKMSFKLSEWEMSRLKELQNQGMPIQQAISQVKNELRGLGFEPKPRNANHP